MEPRTRTQAKLAIPPDGYKESRTNRRYRCLARASSMLDRSTIVETIPACPGIRLASTCIQRGMRQSPAQDAQVPSATFLAEERDLREVVSRPVATPSVPPTQGGRIPRRQKRLVLRWHVVSDALGHAQGQCGCGQHRRQTL